MFVAFKTTLGGVARTASSSVHLRMGGCWREGEGVVEGAQGERTGGRERGHDDTMNEMVQFGIWDGEATRRIENCSLISESDAP